MNPVSKKPKPPTTSTTAKSKKVSPEGISNEDIVQQFFNISYKDLVANFNRDKLIDQVDLELYHEVFLFLLPNQMGEEKYNKFLSDTKHLRFFDHLTAIEKELSEIKEDEETLNKWRKTCETLRLGVKYHTLDIIFEELYCTDKDKIENGTIINPDSLHRVLICNLLAYRILIKLLPILEPIEILAKENPDLNIMDRINGSGGFKGYTPKVLSFINKADSLIKLDRTGENNYMLIPFFYFCLIEQQTEKRSNIPCTDLKAVQRCIAKKDTILKELRSTLESKPEQLKGIEETLSNINPISSKENLPLRNLVSGFTTYKKNHS